MTDDDRLGGRLPLLAPDAMTPDQVDVYDALSRVVLAEADEGHFVARLDDGRFIGPFNSMLRTPALTAAFGQWTAGVVGAGIDPQVRQAVILTVGAAWDAAYELYAHEHAAQQAGLSRAAIDEIVADGTPRGFPGNVELAHRLARAVVRERVVPDDLYARCVDTFGVAGSVALLHLIAQYQLVSSLLTLFTVPAPDAA